MSRRAAAVISHRYDDFPVGIGDLDLRRDASPPLNSTVAVMKEFTGSAADIATYGDVAGEQSLRETLGTLFGVNGANVVVTVGGSEALHLALTCLADPGGPILLPRPAFPGYDQLARLTGLRPVHYDVTGPLPADSTTMLLVCTPHNPTGITLQDVAVHRSGWTIWDVSHANLASEELVGLRAKVTSTSVVVFSLSKLLGLPGLRVGCLLALDLGLIDTVTAVKTHWSMGVDRLAQRLVTQVLEHPSTRDDLAARAGAMASQRGQILEAVAGSRSLAAVPAAAGTFVLVRARDGSRAFDRLRVAGVVGLPGTMFNGTPDTVRLCIAQQPEVIDDAVKRITAL